MPEFKGTKLSQDVPACTAFPDVHKVELDPDCHRFVLDKPGEIGSGGNSGFQALNLALQFGARRIILVGFDMRVDRGIHWHGSHHGSDKLNNPTPLIASRWVKRFDDQADALRKIGAEVINTCSHSALTKYPKMSFEDALRRWEVLQPA